MNIVIYGASGMIGQRITQEALSRGHRVTAIMRDPSHFSFTHPHLTVKQGNILDSEQITQAVAGYDAVINATRQFYGRAASDNGVSTEPVPTFVDVAHALLAGLKQAGVTRLLVVGGAGSLETAPGLLLLDAPDFPAAHRPVALSLRDALGIYRTADLDWTFLSPAPGIAPGERTGHYRTGTDQLVIDAQGESRISAEDLAVALIDELETPCFIRQRFTVAY